MPHVSSFSSYTLLNPTAPRLLHLNSFNVLVPEDLPNLPTLVLATVLPSSVNCSSVFPAAHIKTLESSFPSYFSRPVCGHILPLKRSVISCFPAAPLFQDTSNNQNTNSSGCTNFQLGHSNSCLILYKLPSTERALLHLSRCFSSH